MFGGQFRLRTISRAQTVISRAVNFGAGSPNIPVGNLSPGYVVTIRTSQFSRPVSSLDTPLQKDSTFPSATPSASIGQTTLVVISSRRYRTTCLTGRCTGPNSGFRFMGSLRWISPMQYGSHSQTLLTKVRSGYSMPRPSSPHSLPISASSIAFRRSVRSKKEECKAIRVSDGTSGRAGALLLAGRYVSAHCRIS